MMDLDGADGIPTTASGGYAWNGLHGMEEFGLGRMAWCMWISEACEILVLVFSSSLLCCPWTPWFFRLQVGEQAVHIGAVSIWRHRKTGGI